MAAARPMLEAKDSPVAGKIGCAQAPVARTASSGWLYTWAFGVEKAGREQDSVWKFISRACGKDYERLMGDALGRSRVPAGKCSSTYRRPEYLASAGSFAPQAEAAIRAASVADTTAQPRPAAASSSLTFRSSPSEEPGFPNRSAQRSPATSPWTRRWTPGRRSRSRSRRRARIRSVHADDRTRHGAVVWIDRSLVAGEPRNGSAPAWDQLARSARE